MPKSGKSLEQLVASLERVLSHKANVQVESPKQLPDRTTGKLREHDVVLTIHQGHHSVLVAIECRDRSRPIGVPDVEGFWAKYLKGQGRTAGLRACPYVGQSRGFSRRRGRSEKT